MFWEAFGLGMAFLVLLVLLWVVEGWIRREWLAWRQEVVEAREHAVWEEGYRRWMEGRR